MLTSASPPLWPRPRLEVRGNPDVSHLSNMAAGRQPAYCRWVATASYNLSSTLSALVHAQFRVGLGYQWGLHLCQVEKLPVRQFNSSHRRSSSGTGAPSVALA